MYNMTPGMRRAYSTNRKLQLKGACSGCGLAIPVYAGKYPDACPHCEKDLMTMSKLGQQNESSESDKFTLDDAIEAVQRRRLTPQVAFDKLIGEDTTTINIAQAPPAPLVFPKEKDVQKQKMLALLKQVMNVKKRKQGS